MNTQRCRWCASLAHWPYPPWLWPLVALTPLRTRPRHSARRRGLDPDDARSPSATSRASRAGQAANGNLLGFNDFHGAIDKPTGSGGLVNGVPAGGVEYLATWVKKLRAEAEAEGRESLTVGAGDLIGATPLVSAAFHDEPTIELMNASAWTSPRWATTSSTRASPSSSGCSSAAATRPTGARTATASPAPTFRYLAANVVNKSTGLPILPPFDIRFFDGVPVGFIGMTLEGTPDHRQPGRHHDGRLPRRDRDRQPVGRPAAADRHQVARPAAPRGRRSRTAAADLDPTGCANFAGPVTPIVAGLRPEFGIVVSGHTHQWYTCALPNSSGANSVVTSAGANGRLVTDIDFTLDKRTRRFAEISARNVIVANSDPALVDPTAKVDRRQVPHRGGADRQPGRRLASPPTSRATRAGVDQESPLGDVIADAQLAWTQSAGAQIALMNPGGIRADLIFANSPGGEAPGRSPSASASPCSRSTTWSSPRPSPGHSSRPCWSSTVPGHGPAGAGSCRSRPASPTPTTGPRRGRPDLQHGAQRGRRSTRPRPTG